MNPFFLAIEAENYPAQVLAAWVPELRDKPFVVIAQDADSRKTAVLACSTAAHRMGVHAGMPVFVVRKRFPQVLITPQNLELEETAQEEISRVLVEFTPEFVVSTRGRALLNLTGTPIMRDASGTANFEMSFRGGFDEKSFQKTKISPCGRNDKADCESKGIAIADLIRNEVISRVGLGEIAAGLSCSALVARILCASSLPNGSAYCPPGDELAALAPLKTYLLPGLSAQCREKLKDYGLKTIGEIQKLSREFLADRMGQDGDTLYGLVRGVSGANETAKPQAIRASVVLAKDQNDNNVLTQHVRYVADNLCHTLHNMRRQTRQITMILKYSDNKRVQKSVRLPAPTSDFEVVATVAQTLFGELYQRRVALREIVLCPGKLDLPTGQIDMFEAERERKQQELAAGINRIRNRMGFEAILNAATMQIRRADANQT